MVRRRCMCVLQPVHQPHFDMGETHPMSLAQKIVSLGLTLKMNCMVKASWTAFPPDSRTIPDCELRWEKIRPFGLPVVPEV